MEYLQEVQSNIRQLIGMDADSIELLTKLERHQVLLTEAFAKLHAVNQANNRINYGICMKRLKARIVRCKAKLKNGFLNHGKPVIDPHGRSSVMVRLTKKLAHRRGEKIYSS